MGGDKIRAAGLVSFVVLLGSFLSFSAAESGDGEKMQTFTVVSLADIQRPMQPQKQRPTAAESDDQPKTAGLRLDILNHLDLLSRTERNDIDHAQVFLNRLQRDADRVSAISNRRRRTAAAKVISGLLFGSGEYFARLGVGAPAKDMYLVLDTGSDLSWIQCTPCKSCYDQADPIFDSRNSTTFASFRCGQPFCKSIVPSYAALCKPNSPKKCQYVVEYGDGSVTVGDLATDTLTLGKNARVEKVAFGCGRYNKGMFTGAAGLLGLGRLNSSFPSQLGGRPGLTSTFSYCLPARGSNTTASIVFGHGDDHSSSSSGRPVYTPLVKNLPKGLGIETFYYVHLKGISVGGKRVRGIKPSLFHINRTSGEGGLIFDSGTAVTRLNQLAYIALRDAFLNNTRALPRASNFSILDACFNFSGMETVEVPTVVLHFKRANVSLPAENLLVPVDSNGTFCFAFAGTDGGLSIIGNIQQQGFRVIYDVANSRLGFNSEGCS